MALYCLRLRSEETNIYDSVSEGASECRRTKGLEH